jgi:type VI secretion system protein ImpF
MVKYQTRSDTKKFQMTVSAAKIITVPSVLDRLIDDEPQESRESLAGRFQSIRELEQVVLRDVEALLNSRQETLEELPGEFVEASRSLVTYGLPDLTSMSLQSESDRNRIRRAVEAAISSFETRLKDVHVALEIPQRQNDGLRFRIDALLRIEPAPQPVTFDAILQPNSQQYVIRGPR